MKIRDLLAVNRPSVSFEVFPPKKREVGDEAEAARVMDKTRAVVAEIAALKPAFISVTYGAAGGSTGANTCAIAEHVQACGVPALAHLTCVTSSRDHIADELKRFREHGIENLLCLRGDFPPAVAADEAARRELYAHSDFPHAVDLVKALRPSAFCLGGACYPEGHPECAHLEDDIAYLKAKVEAGLDFLTTQMFFDNNVYFHYLSRLRDAGITVPVVAGVMPVANGRQINRIAALSGTYLPPRFRAIVDRFGDRPESMLDAGIAYATEQIVDLFANGVNHVHVYTMNRPEIATRICRNLGGIIGD